jgi:tetratricopeptide (TPR) repeat protein
VIIAIRLKRLGSKLALLVPSLIVGLLLLNLVRQHFIIRAFSDTRYTVASSALTSALEMLPASPRLNWRLAEALIKEKSDFAGALDYAERAVALSPLNEAYWLVRAQAQEGVGQIAEAEASMRRAAALAPKSSEVNWALANLLVRMGKFDEATEPFHIAGQLSPTLYPAAFELLWQVNGGQKEQLSAIAGKEVEGQMALMQFFAEQELFEDATKTFRHLDRQKALASPISISFINTLIIRKQPELAREVWLSLVTKEAATTSETIWNGGFERESLPSMSHFDWYLGENKYARSGLEAGRGRAGSRALRLVFTGLDTTNLNGEVTQRVVLKPGLKYRLEAYAKPGKLVTPEGPRLAIRQNNVVLATSQPVDAELADWQKLVVEFTAPTDPNGLSIAIVRIPKYVYDEPTSGTIWFDDFSLRAQ